MANNPLNIRFSAQNDWLGQSGNDRGFVDFQDDAFSYRAADQLISSYATNRGARSVRDVISVYAPPNENDTDNYIRFVSGQMNVNPDDQLDLSDPNLRSSMLSAMAMMESGVKITPGQVTQKIKSANEPDLSSKFDSVFGKRIAARSTTPYYDCYNRLQIYLVAQSYPQIFQDPISTGNVGGFRAGSAV